MKGEAPNAAKGWRRTICGDENKPSCPTSLLVLLHPGKRSSSPFTKKMASTSEPDKLLPPTPRLKGVEGKPPSPSSLLLLLPLTMSLLLLLLYPTDKSTFSFTPTESSVLFRALMVKSARDATAKRRKVLWWVLARKDK